MQMPEQRRTVKRNYDGKGPFTEGRPNPTPVSEPPSVRANRTEPCPTPARPPLLFPAAFLKTRPGFRSTGESPARQEKEAANSHVVAPR